jgi:hypothetical protein
MAVQIVRRHGITSILLQSAARVTARACGSPSPAALGGLNGNVVQRVLDIDLDFFVTPVIHWPQHTR